MVSDASDTPWLSLRAWWKSSQTATRILIAVSVVVGIAVCVSIRMLDHERLSALGSIVGGGGSLLAVLWFSAGLRYQSIQLEEQRKQFAAQFVHLKESGRREALMLARDILQKAEIDAIKSNGTITAIGELFVEYARFEELKPILQSTNPAEVIREYQKWMKKEGAALTLLAGIKSAAEVYFRGVGTPANIDYTKTPEDFYYLYSPWLINLPYFQSLAGTANILSEFMVRLQPGRDAAMIAFWIASGKASSFSILKMDKLRDDIAKHLAKGYSLPEIAKLLPEKA